MNRISWEEYAILLAKTASLRSEDPFRKVGACALSYSNKVLGVAYNGLQEKFKTPENFWHDRDARRPYMIHAETNLLSLFQKGECKLLAVTLFPCQGCARQIIAWNIPEVIYLEEYCNIESKDSKKIFDFYNIKYKKIVF